MAQHFDGDGPVEQRIVCAVHNAHAAAAKLGIEAIPAAQQSADHDGLTPQWGTVRASSVRAREGETQWIQICSRSLRVTIKLDLRPGIEALAG